MFRFECDYQEGCHPRILARMAETNLEQTSGYGADPHCKRARALIQKAVGVPDAEVHFLVGGTQTNATVIKALLRPCQGVLCVESGHINVHEAGAIESTGHKVLSLQGKRGLLDAGTVRQYLKDFYDDETREHRVQPGMVYISHPSEYGTLYSKRQLEELRAVCTDYGLPLFLDGARLGYGVTAQGTDVTVQDVARLCDVFYIGGTKVGALFGEAVVRSRPGRLKDFRTLIKQQGGMLAKGRLLGIQFETLFEDGLYFEIARHANEQAMRIRAAFLERGFPLFIDSPTNQQFPILTEYQIEQLKGEFSFERWQRMDEERSAVRFCTSWATTPESVDALTARIGTL